MRIKGGHIAGLAVTAIFAFIVFAIIMLPETPSEDPTTTSGNTEGPTIPPPYIQGSSRTSSQNDIMSQGVGALPPEGMSDDFVAAIEIETDHLNVGTVPNDRLSHHELKIRSVGKMTLKISKIGTTCPCTEGVIANGVLAPGEEAIIDVIIDPKRIGGFDSTKVLTIFSNDPHNGAAQVKVTAHVDPEYEIVPNPVDFGEIEKGSTAPLVLTMRQLEDEPPLLVSSAVSMDRLLADTPLDDLKLEVTPVEAEQRTNPEKNEYTIRITPEPELPPGPFKRRIAIDTNVPRLQGFPAEIEITGEVKAPYSVSPVFPDRIIIRPGEDKPAVLTVNAEESVEIFDVHYDPEKLSVGIRNEGNSAYLDVRSAPDAPTGRLEGEIRYSVRIGDKTYVERTGVIRTFAG